MQIDIVQICPQRPALFGIARHIQDVVSLVRAADVTGAARTKLGSATPDPEFATRD